MCYTDDILVTGKTDEEHLVILEKVFAHFQVHGYVIATEEIKATPTKVEAISQAPKPKSKTELRSSLGLVNYYGKLIPQLATITKPLNQLLCKKTHWKSNTKCQKAFTTLKTKLTSTHFLIHYDVNLPLRLACDASAYM